MPETVEQFIKKWQTVLGIVIAAAFGYGMKTAETAGLRDDLDKVELKVEMYSAAFSIIDSRLSVIESEQRNQGQGINRIESSQAEINKILLEISRNSK